MDRRRWFKTLLHPEKFLAATSSIDAVTGAASKAGFRPEPRPPDAAQNSLAQAEYATRLSGKRVRCDLCPNRCVLSPGQAGRCRTRENIGGTLFSNCYGLTVAPVLAFRHPQSPLLYHGLKGGMGVVGLVGCGLRCSFCYAWKNAQADPRTLHVPVTSPVAALEYVRRQDATCLAFTNHEPINNFEYTFDLASLAKSSGMPCLLGTAGYVNAEPLAALFEYVDGFNVGIKAFSDAAYRKYTGGRLAPVLDRLKMMRASGKPLEVSYLVIPTLNDSSTEIRTMAAWVRDNLGPYTPVSLSRFYPSFKLTNLPPTPPATLYRAQDICRQEGLKFVQFFLANILTDDNVWDNPKRLATVHCPYCNAVLVSYNGQAGGPRFVNNVRGGKCGGCGKAIPGLMQVVSRV